MTDAPAVTALDLPPAPLSERTAAYFDKCREKLGLVPNVLWAYAFDPAKLDAFTAMYNDLMLADSPLTKLEREMIAVTVSAANRCHYCIVAHGAALRALTGDARLVDTLIANHRVANLTARQRAMVDYAFAMTMAPHTMGPHAHGPLREAGFDDRAIWDITAVAAFFNMTNRVASATAMAPNGEYYEMARGGAGEAQGKGG